MNHLGLTRDIFGYLIQRAGLKPHQKTLTEVRKRLFGDFDARLLQKNQKFDFSFRFAPEGEPGFRFSYNDFGERYYSPDKFLDAFSLLASRRARCLARKLLNIRPAPAPYQTTFGLEWRKKQKAPRLKIYFEELLWGCSTGQRKDILGDAIDSLGWKRPRAMANLPDPAAIAVDFLPSDERHLKIYTLYPDAPALTRALKQIASIGAQKIFERFSSTAEQEESAFYYLTQRWRRGFSYPSDKKIYKIYNVRMIRNFTAAHREIDQTLSVFACRRAEQLRSIGRFREICRRYRAVPYPVILAITLSSPCTIDVYQAIRPTQP